MRSRPRPTVLADAEAVAAALAGLVARALRSGAATLALAGGTTPRRAYQLLAELEEVPWGAVTVLFGDERCVPPDHPESNFRMARETLLDRRPPGAVMRMAGELGADRAADLYDARVRALGPLDLAVIGVGADGHTCSLFPGHPALAATGAVVAVHDSPQPPPDRVSLTLTTLRAARRVVVVAAGTDKAEAVRRALRGEVPAGMVEGAEFLVDAGAGAEL